MLGGASQGSRILNVWRFQGRVGSGFDARLVLEPESRPNQAVGATIRYPFSDHEYSGVVGGMMVYCGDTGLASGYSMIDKVLKYYIILLYESLLYINRIYKCWV